MNGKMIIEFVGYIGSILIVVSLVMTSVVRLRIINTIGAVVFTIYALIIRSYPTAVMNLILVGVNIYNLHRLLKEQKHYDLVRTDPGDKYTSYILERSMSDILIWFPEFSPENKADITCLVCCDRNPAGLFMGRSCGKGRIEVLLDYATPVYRDTTVGRFLYDQLAKEGYKELIFKGNAPKHVAYMEKVGYKRNDRGEYVLAMQS